MATLKFTTCCSCYENFSPSNVFTLEGARETQISSMCERCFDKLFDDADDDSLCRDYWDDEENK